MNFVSHLKLRLQTSSISNDIALLILSIIVGLTTGLGAYTFIRLLREISIHAADLRDDYGLPASLLILTGAGFIVGIIISQFAREAKGHGVPEVMEAIALHRGVIRTRIAFAKIVASAITIGSGGSAGREGPIVQVGSTLGSTAGRWARLSEEQVGTLVACGAAAGISATFNAPIAGSMFALEIILGRLSNRYLGMVVISSVSANVVSRALLGENPAFQVPTYPLNSPLELPFYFVVAVLCAVGAILFIRTLYRAESIFDNIRIPLPVKTACGMGLTGLMAQIDPEVLGPGLEFIGEAIADNVTLTISGMLALFFLKLLATTFTLGSGNSGGVFAPALFMGAMIGGVVGKVGHELAPHIVTNPGAFALVGMAALFAGTARAPITAIIIVLEMSNDYRLIVPLLMCVAISTLLADVIQSDTIYTVKLTLRGIRLQRGQDIDLLQAVEVREVMSANFETIAPDAKLSGVVARFRESHHHGFPIVDAEQHLQGIVTLTDIERANRNQISPDTPVLEIATTNVVTVFPDDPVHRALQRMNTYHIGRLPVISRDADPKFKGMIGRAAILHAYDVSIARKSVAQHREKHFKLRDMEQNEFLDLEVAEGAPMVEHTLAEFPYSDDCLIISIHRQGQVIMAHGNTTIQAGDWVTVYVPPELGDKIRQAFSG